MGKDKKEKKVMDDSQNNGAETEEMSYEDRLKYVSIISKPMAPKKLTKKVRNQAIIPRFFVVVLRK